jgi:hypothetical protein
MMQSYASAAKLRGSGPILHRGLEAMEATSGHRHLGSSSAAPSMGRQSGCHIVLLFLVSPAIAHAAGRKMTPSGTSPVVTRRHSAMSSLRASATIIVLRVLPRPSAVRASNYFAKALSFWNLIKHQANWIMPRRTRAFPARARPRSRRRLPLSSGEPGVAGDGLAIAQVTREDLVDQHVGSNSIIYKNRSARDVAKKFLRVGCHTDSDPSGAPSTDGSTLPSSDY